MPLTVNLSVFLRGGVKNPKPISSKRLRNEYGLIRPVLKKYRKDIDFEEISLPQIAPRNPELIPPEFFSTL